MLKILFAGLLSLQTFLSFAQGSAVSGSRFLTGELHPESFVTVSQFMAGNREQHKVALSWEVRNQLIEYISIERSINGHDFEALGVLKLDSSKKRMEWIDEQVPSGKISYRLKCSFRNSFQCYTSTISTTVTGALSFKFYPNPVDQILILRSEQPVDIIIMDANGKQRISQTQLSGLQWINVASLEKGVYLLRVYHRSLNSFTQEQLIKK